MSSRRSVITTFVTGTPGRPKRGRKRSWGSGRGEKSAGGGRAGGARVAKRWAQQEAGGEQERDHAPNHRIAEGVGDISEDHGAQSRAEEHDAAEDAHGPAATALGRDVHEQ